MEAQQAAERIRARKRGDLAKMTQDAHLRWLVKNLYESRKRFRDARDFWKERARELGQCTANLTEDKWCHETNRPKEQWCDVCLKREVTWEAYRTKSTLAAVALRAVLHAGMKLSLSEHKYVIPIGPVHLKPTASLDSHGKY